MRKQAKPEITAALLETVDTQLRDLTPPEIKEVYDRLVASGISDQETRRLIATVLICEINEMVKYQKTYNAESYVASLRKLPKLPWE